MQSLIPTTTNHTLFSTFKHMVKTEGILRPFRGIGAVVAGAGPAHAFYFATYEHSKKVMSELFPTYDHLNYGKTKLPLHMYTYMLKVVCISYSCFGCNCNFISRRHIKSNRSD